MTTIVLLRDLDRGNVSNRLEEATVIEPIDPFECCELDDLEMTPRCSGPPKVNGDVEPRSSHRSINCKLQ